LTTVCSTINTTRSRWLTSFFLVNIYYMRIQMNIVSIHPVTGHDILCSRRMLEHTGHLDRLQSHLHSRCGSYQNVSPVRLDLSMDWLGLWYTYWSLLGLGIAGLPTSSSGPAMTRSDTIFPPCADGSGVRHTHYARGADNGTMNMRSQHNVFVEPLLGFKSGTGCHTTTIIASSVSCSPRAASSRMKLMCGAVAVWLGSEVVSTCPSIELPPITRRLESRCWHGASRRRCRRWGPTAISSEATWCTPWTPLLTAGATRSILQRPALTANNYETDVVNTRSTMPHRDSSPGGRKWGKDKPKEHEWSQAGYQQGYWRLRQKIEEQDKELKTFREQEQAAKDKAEGETFTSRIAEGVTAAFTALGLGNRHSGSQASGSNGAARPPGAPALPAPAAPATGFPPPMPFVMHPAAGMSPHGLGPNPVGGSRPTDLAWQLMGWPAGVPPSLHHGGHTGQHQGQHQAAADDLAQRVRSIEGRLCIDPALRTRSGYERSRSQRRHHERGTRSQSFSTSRSRSSRRRSSRGSRRSRASARTSRGHDSRDGSRGRSRRKRYSRSPPMNSSRARRDERRTPPLTRPRGSRYDASPSPSGRASTDNPFSKARPPHRDDPGPMLPLRHGDAAEEPAGDEGDEEHGADAQHWAKAVDLFRTASGPELNLVGEPQVSSEATAHDWIRWLLTKLSMDWLEDISASTGDTKRYSSKTARAKAILKTMYQNAAASGDGR
jgi:hypothetical protein